MHHESAASGGGSALQTPSCPICETTIRLFMPCTGPASMFHQAAFSQMSQTAHMQGDNAKNSSMLCDVKVAATATAPAMISNEHTSRNTINNGDISEYNFEDDYDDCGDMDDKSSTDVEQENGDSARGLSRSLVQATHEALHDAPKKKKRATSHLSASNATVFFTTPLASLPTVNAPLQPQSPTVHPIPARRGKWSRDEWAYAQRLVQDFHDGLLPLEDGTSLRTLLATALNCDPMRISKKFVGKDCIGECGL